MKILKYLVMYAGFMVIAFFQLILVQLEQKLTSFNFWSFMALYGMWSYVMWGYIYYGIYGRREEK